MSADWGNGAALKAGAATWGNGDALGPRLVGTVTPGNSLVGSTGLDRVGSTATALTDGNYAVGSPAWDGGAVDVGAVTWGNGATGAVTGPVSSVNSYSSKDPPSAGIPHMTRVTTISN